MRRGTRLLICLFICSATAWPSAFVRDLRKRFAATPCPARFSYRVNLEDLADHHLLDLEPLGLDLAEAAFRASLQEGVRTGGKTFPFILGFNDHFIRPFRNAVTEMLRTSSGETPLYLAVVGLGREADEFPVLLEILDDALRAKTFSLDRVDLRLGFYDVELEALTRADQWTRWAEEKFPWSKGRIEVRYLDMSIPNFLCPWMKRRLGMVMVRNSLRDQIVDRGWPLVLATTAKLVDGGLMVVDRMARSRLIGHSVFLNQVPADVEPLIYDFNLVLEDAGQFGLRDDDSETFLLRRRARTGK